MFKNFARAGALALAASLAGAPVVTQAAVSVTSQTVHANYETTIGPIMGFAVPWTGKLQLTFHPDGIIQGYYRPDGNGAFVPVTGGRTGNKVWLDIGARGRLHVSASLENGRIVGSAIDQKTGKQYSFKATPTQ